MRRDEARLLFDRIMQLPRAGELTLSLHGVERLGTRFNDCAISQNVFKRQNILNLSARLGQKKAALSINRLDDFELIERSIERLFATCRHMPEDEEVMPACGELLETSEHAFSESAEVIEIDTVGKWVASACAEGAAAGVDLAGLLAQSRMVSAYADSAGGFAFERHHRADFHVTATGDAGSGWAEHQGIGIAADDVAAATRRALEKCEQAQKPRVFEPRPVTVILEPQAVGDLLSMAFWYGFDQRARDEGRSAFADHADALGELSLYSDPADPGFPCVSFANDGQRLQKSMWLEQGRLRQLATSRYWAKYKGLTPKPAPRNLLLSGAGTPLDDMIRATDDGILVTRFWYIRSTDAKSLAFTGMTRDGTYRIEDGAITYPVVDMRWNESVLRLLRNVVASGIPTATGEFIAMSMPALKVEAFRFSSLSE